LTATRTYQHSLFVCFPPLLFFFFLRCEWGGSIALYLFIYYLFIYLFIYYLLVIRDGDCKIRKEKAQYCFAQIKKREPTIAELGKLQSGVHGIEHVKTRMY